jgi:hypothetical protein
VAEAPITNAKTTVSEVELRTVPNVRKSADASTFVKDYLAYVDDADNVPKELVERQYADVRQTAMQRGMRPTGDVELIEMKIVNKHNVILIYSVPVVVATIDSEIEQGTKEAVASEQTATGKPVTAKAPGASTADGKTVDTSAPVPPATGAPTPQNADVTPAAASATKLTTTASTSEGTASAEKATNPAKA